MCDCGPNILAKVEKERKKSAKWQDEWDEGACREAYWDYLVLHVREGFVVLLADHMCSYGKWDKTCIP